MNVVISTSKSIGVNNMKLKIQSNIVYSWIIYLLTIINEYKHFLVRNLFIGGNSHDFTQTLGSIFRVMSFSHIQMFQEKHVGFCANVAFCMHECGTVLQR